jgi:hypothetical protein
VTAATGTWALTLRNLKKTVHYREGRNNSNMFSRGLGRPAEFWCADYVEYELKVSGVPRIGTSPSTAKAESQYKRAGRLGTKPRVGSQFFLYSPSEGRVFHTGIVLELLSGDRVRTIEGNTNDDGSNNGNGVYIRIRPAHRPANRAGIRSYGYPRYTPAPPPGPVAITAAAGRVKKIKAVQKLLGEIVVDGDIGPKTQARFAEVRSRCRAHRTAHQVQLAALQRVIGVRPLAVPAWGPKTDSAFRKLGFRA